MQCIYTLQTYCKKILKKNNHNDSDIDLEKGLTNIESIDTIESSYPTKNLFELDSKWSFWNIYINYGLNGSLINVFLLNRVALFMIVCEFIINTFNTYSVSVITKTLSMLSKSSNIIIQRTDTDNVASYDQKISMIYFIFLLVGILYSSDISKCVERFTRNYSSLYRLQIIERIEKVIINHLKKASPETNKIYNIDDKNEALSKFLFLYESLTESLIDTIVQSLNSLYLCVYIVYHEPLIFFVLIVVYFIIWKYIIPYANKQKIKSESGDKYWQNAYYDIFIDASIQINPLYTRLYKSNSVFDLDSTKIERPNIVKSFIDILSYYNSRSNNWRDSYDIMQITQHIILSLILILMFYNERYDTALIILINKYALFSAIDTFGRLKRIEQDSERSLSSIQKILMAIDNQINDHRIQNISIPKQLVNIDNIESHIQSHIQSINIEQMKIIIPGQKTKQTLDSDPDPDPDPDQIDGTKPYNFDRIVYLNTCCINYQIGKVLLLDGVTGCGKSVTLNTIAGLYSGKICKEMKIKFTDNTVIDGEFNQILGSRCYISQMLSDDFKYRGKISLSMDKMFPGANIQEIRSFLIEIFLLKPQSIPTSLTDTPQANLSGGEIQRYVVASQIWRAIRIMPDMLILDEIDRALDKETAVHVISWILTNIKSFFVIVSHLSEVKQMLMDKKIISQIWTYQISDTDNQIININTHLK
jgi:ABC-type multidrug transport system ATPase subunit